MASNLGLQQPAPLELQGNLAENWKRFKQRYNLFNVATGMSEKDDKAQCSLLLHCIGQNALKIYNSFTFPEGDEMNLKEVMKKFESYCNPRKNVTYERYKFFTRTQQNSETIDHYAAELRNLTQSCEFKELTDSLIQDRIICGMQDSHVRERLLRQVDLTLDKTLSICRAAEQTRKQVQEMGNSDEKIAVDFMKNSGAKSKIQKNKPKQSFTGQKKPLSQNQKQKSSQQSKNPCSRCGNFHGQGQCPAVGQLCRKCGKRNHFSKCCKTPTSKVNELRENENTQFVVDSIENESEREWKVQIEVNQTQVQFKIDTGAQISTLSETEFQKLKPKPKLHPVKTNLRGYSGNPIPSKGKCYTEVKYKGITHNMAFFVVPGNRQSLLGLKDCDRLKLVKRVFVVENDQEKEIPDKYPDVFEGLGCLPGKHHISLVDNAVPVKHACRKVPFPLRDKLKEELDKMENMNVIKSVDEPTDWVSSLVIVAKPNGKLRVCLDPRDLNKVVKREHYKLPTRDEISAEFAGAKYFSKLDASSGFWQIELDEESSKLCTFITPFGRYRFLRLPFGICSAPEVFHKIIYNLFVHVPGVNTMMDDIVVWGSTKEEHDDRLSQVLEIARKSNLKLNRDKCEFRVNQLTFIGDLISQDGIKPDPKKVAAIKNMERPKCKQEVQRFLGMINYQGKFIQDLSTKSAALRILLDKKTEFMWEEAQETAWCQLKEALTELPVLRFYDSKLPTKISSDASKDGLGAVLLQQDSEQNWHPVAYASRSMTDAETRYAQIEKELLAITYGCERFHQYVYGQVIEVETDHKPLIPLFTKPLSDCPLRIQRLMIRVQKYDLRVSYTPGKYMYTADTLSRAVDPQAERNQKTEEDIKVYVDTIIETLPVTTDRMKQFVEETKKDTVLQQLSEVIKAGWPKTQHDCPITVRPYWHARSELSEANGLILKGNRIVTPASMKRQMLMKIHEGHLGIEKCKRRAREVLYWPQMNQDITEMVQNCSACMLYKPKQQQESLQQHEIPERPWEKVATDLFALNGKDYLIVVDYYSQFLELRKLTTTSSNAVIVQLKEIFARHGTPCEVVSDNGPQYASHEFKMFAKEWDFVHTTSSPYYPQSNGRAENAVKIAKNLLKKCQVSGQDIYRALQVYRSTPLDCGKSPAELLYNRRVRSNLPMTDKLLDPQQIDSRRLRERRNKQKAKLKERYDLRARDLPELNIGDRVQLLDMNSNKWTVKGVVKKKLPNRSYLIETESGEIRRRNRRHIRPQPRRRQDQRAPFSDVSDDDQRRYRHDTFYDDDDDDDQSRDVRDDNPPAQDNAPAATTTRSGRIVKPPDRLIEH